MIILSIDCSLASSSVAILHDENVISEDFNDEKNAQSRLIAEMIQKAVKEAGVGFDDIDLLAVTTGPGSFTGIRIGISAAKGLEIALKKPLAGISTFEAAAYGYIGEEIAVLIDSRRDDYFIQTFNKEGCPTRAPDIINKQEVDSLSCKIVYADAEKELATNAARIAGIKYGSGSIPETAPLYIRPPDITKCKK